MSQTYWKSTVLTAQQCALSHIHSMRDFGYFAFYFYSFPDFSYFLHFSHLQRPSSFDIIFSDAPISPLLKMKQTKKLDLVNQKIAELTAQKKTLENQMIESISKQVASLLIKKHATDIDIKLFLQMVDSVIDEMMKS